MYIFSDMLNWLFLIVDLSEFSDIGLFGNKNNLYIVWPWLSRWKVLFGAGKDLLLSECAESRIRCDLSWAGRNRCVTAYSKPACHCLPDSAIGTRNVSHFPQRRKL